MRPLEEIAKSLFQRLDRAEKAPFRSVRIGEQDDLERWLPSPHLCYDNVDIWVRRSPEYKAIRGWAVFDLRVAAPIFSIPPHIKFVGHSVVEMPDGTLIDITPSDVSRRPLFLRHDDAYEEFEALRMKYIPLEIVYVIK